MSDQSITTPNASTFPLEDLVSAVLEGRVRIPEFQRAFRWQWEDVRRLLDSIVRGYPIGSLLLWERPADATKLTLGALEIDAPEVRDALWVVDGQQRLTSLACALNGAGSKDPRFATSYDLAMKIFRRGQEDQPHSIPLPVVFDLQRLIKWFSEHTESAAYFDEATRAAKAIRQYSVPAYIVKHKDEAVLRDIFDRMNNYGKRLTRAEVFSALHAGEQGKAPPRRLPDIVDHIDARSGFGRVDDDTVLRAVLARRGPDVTRDIRAEFGSKGLSREFPEETVDDAYRGGEEALSSAVAFLQEDAGVPHFGFLTYRYLLVVLTRFFAHHPKPSPRNRLLLRRWYWRAAMVGPEAFSGWTQALRTLTSTIVTTDEGESVQQLLKAIEPHKLRWPDMQKFRSNSAAWRMFLCALWSLEPRSVVTGEPYARALISQALGSRSTASDIVHTILPREPEGGRARAANRFILLGDDSLEEARSRFTNGPYDPQESDWERTLASHCLDAECSGYLGTAQLAEFVEHRTQLVQSATNAFLARMTERQFEDTPPLDELDLDDQDPEGLDGDSDDVEV